MKELLKYRNNSYFNDTDYFLALNNLGQLYLTELDNHNSRWFPREHKAFEGGKLYASGHWRPINRSYNQGCLQVNFIGLPAVNCNELYGREVELGDTGLKGRVSKFLLHNVGVNWYQGQGELPTHARGDGLGFMSQNSY
jgi:hypothetical protein